MIHFSKYSGCGNDFILFDHRKSHLPYSISEIQQLCCRKNGIGADGVIFLETSSQADVKMRIFNSDGSEAEMCGNGLRCLAKFVNDLSPMQNMFTVETPRGTLKVEVRPHSVIAEMPEVQEIQWNLVISQKETRQKEIWHLHALDTGVPHAVLFVNDTESQNIMDIGRKIRFHPFFSPKGTNVNFVQVLSKDSIRIRTYERGVEGETDACGTGATAGALAAAHEFDLGSPITVLPRSEEKLIISFERSDAGFSKVFMEGKVACVTQGS